MKTNILLAFASLLLSPLYAQTTPAKPAKVSIIASAFRGKSFEECEKILGKPTSTLEPKPDAVGDQRCIVQIYMSPAPGIAKIELFRAPEGGENGPIGAKVNFVKYHFPKGKTWKECIALIGMNPDEVTLRVPDHANKPKDSALSLVDKEKREIVWVPSAATLNGPDYLRNPDYDTLNF